MNGTNATYLPFLLLLVTWSNDWISPYLFCVAKSSLWDDLHRPSLTVANSNSEKYVHSVSCHDDDDGKLRICGWYREFQYPLEGNGASTLRGGSDRGNDPTTTGESSNPLFIPATNGATSTNGASSGISNNIGNNRMNRRGRGRPSYRRYGGRSSPLIKGGVNASSRSTLGMRRNAMSASQQSYQQPLNSSNNNNINRFQSFWDWIQTVNLPQIQVRAEPTTTLKLRKRFPFLKTVATLGADCNLQMGVWQFRSSWEDSIIGGSLTLVGRELQFQKAWLLSTPGGGGISDLLATRLRLRAAVDLGTLKAYIRFGFRSERLSPINLAEGFTVMKQLPLDGQQGHVKLEFKANVSLPQPEIEFSTETRRGSLFSGVGMSDVEVNIEELNLLLDY